MIRTINNDEIANFESGSVIFHQRMTHGLQMLASYTWSKTLDISSDPNGGGTPMIPYNWRADYGYSNWDVPHRFVMSFNYDVPFFAGSNAVLKAVFSKWAMNGVVTLQSGFPFNVSTGTDTANTAASGTYRPNLVGTATENCGRGHLTGCIDPTAFSIAALYPATQVFAYGNLGRNIFHGPGSATTDFSIFKNFPIKERLRFQIRLESFGLFNHANFANPAATINTSSLFGNITGLAANAPGTRNIQIGAKLQF